MEIKILACVPKEIRQMLKHDMTGEVVMVNSSGVYLRFEEQIVLLSILHLIVLRPFTSASQYKWLQCI